MIAAELRGGNNSSLNEALRWIGSRVDDIYGASVGRLEDVWIDPGTGVPRWLLVKEGRFGGRTTLIPFGDATAGAGHVWVPYEKEIVSNAPEIEPGAPLTQHVEAALRSHYATHVPSAISSSSPAGPEPGPSAGEATAQFTTPLAEPENQTSPQPQLPPRPAPPIEGANASQNYANPEREQPQRHNNQGSEHHPEPWQAAPQPAPSQQPVPGWQTWNDQQGEQEPNRDQQRSRQEPAATPEPQEYGQGAQEKWQGGSGSGPVESLSVLADADSPHYIEIELSGGLRISGDLRSLKVFPRPPSSPER